MQTIEDLIKRVHSYMPTADGAIIRKAYDFAATVHKEHKRLSGDPYITHPLAVAAHLADLEQDDKTIAASLLHDTIEDSQVQVEDIEREFGHEISRLVSGVTKIGQLVFESKEERQAENFRKMLLAMGEDIRVIIIKLADRLHNMQTLQYLPPDRQVDISKETREIFAPLAHRLGMWRLKWQLEDLSFRYLEPKEFETMKQQIAQRRGDRETYVTEFAELVRGQLNKVSIQSEVHGRAKHFYSIYRKLVEQHLEIDDLYDLFAVRVIVESVKDCYAALGVVHSVWKPIPGRFRDFIAVPKGNGYQSLHTTVIGPQGRPVEIQIRTEQMHRIAEYGVAAHWRYKEGGEGSRFDSKLSWLRQMLEWQTDLKDSKDFLHHLKVDLLVDEIFVFTPKGTVIGLPVSSTPIDFAYRVHTEVGHRCVGSKINGRIMPLDTHLKNGDIVEVLTSKVDSPRLDWLTFVKTSGARAKIKQWFKKQRQDEQREQGRSALKEELRRLDISEDRVTQDVWTGLLKKFTQPNVTEFYESIGFGELSALQVARAIREIVASPDEEEILSPGAPPSSGARPKKRASGGIQVAGLSGVLTRASKCCAPIPGDPIVGCITKGRGVSVHRADCRNVTVPASDDTRFVDVSWDRTDAEMFPAEIEVVAFDRVGVLKDVVAQISENKTNIANISLRTKRGSSAVMRFVVDIRNLDHLTELMKSIRDVHDVMEVTRVTQKSTRTGHKEKE